jgi:hypothetical protein
MDAFLACSPESHGNVKCAACAPSCRDEHHRLDDVAMTAGELADTPRWLLEFSGVVIVHQRTRQICDLPFLGLSPNSKLGLGPNSNKGKSAKVAKNKSCKKQEFANKRSQHRSLQKDDTPLETRAFRDWPLSTDLACHILRAITV